jgi:hypothetical protein
MDLKAAKKKADRDFHEKDLENHITPAGEKLKAPEETVAGKGKGKGEEKPGTEETDKGKSDEKGKEPAVPLTPEEEQARDYQLFRAQELVRGLAQMKKISAVK